MSRITGVIVALATAAAVLTGSTAGGAPPPPAPVGPVAELPREIPSGVELTLADGDRFRVWTSDNHRTVWGRRHDAATGVWGVKAIVFRHKDLECGSVDARTANGAVAVIAECDPGWSEDTAPTSSRALWSPDTVTWSSYELEGEAHEEPGISPDGTNAVWPLHGGYVTRTEAGFVPHTLDTEGQEYTVTATITDAEQVSFLYAAQIDNVCRLVIQSRTGDAPPTLHELSLVNACQDTGFANVDSDTTWFGELGSRAARSTIARTDADSPWAVTEVAPIYAPGLLEADGRLATRIFDAQGGPLVALGAVRRRVRAQTYDPTSRTWGAASVVFDAGRKRCAWGDNWTDGDLSVLAAVITCGGRHVVLTTRDALTWQALRMGRNVLGVSPDGRYAAVPSRSTTSIISPERGVVTLPGGVSDPCDVVVPDGPDAAVLLTAAGRNRGWPTILKRSGPSGWHGPSRTNLPTFAPACLEARGDAYDLPYRYSIHSRFTGYYVRIVERDGVWTVRRSRY